MTPACGPCGGRVMDLIQVPDPKRKGMFLPAWRCGGCGAATTKRPQP